MAFTYKAIGNTAAAVVSLLAVGTALWWNRTPGPIDAPRPQDEAEIMTAILERHYGMWRTNVYYGADRLAYVSTVLTTVVSTIETNIGGTNITITVTNPATAYITNSPALTLTNTIGFFPSAPYRLASGLRAAFISRANASTFAWWADTSFIINLQKWETWLGSDGYAAWQVQLYGPVSELIFPVGWIVPEDSYMDSGDLSWFGSIMHTNVFTAPFNFYSKWEGYDDGYFGSTWNEFADVWQARQQFVWTNYVSLPTATWRTSTNYPSSTIRTQVVGLITNVMTSTVWSVTNYINSSTVNTFVRQGQKDYEAVAMVMPFERDDPAVRRVDAWRPGGSAAQGGPADHYSPAYWSTNVYRDMGRALSLLQWIRDYRQETTNVYWLARYTNGILRSISSTTSFSVAYPSAGSTRSISSGITNSDAWGTSVLYDFANPISFPVDNVLFQQTARVNTNCPYVWDAGPTSIVSVAAGAVGSSGWWPINPDAMRTFVDDFARTNTTANTQIVFLMSIPYDCYHVQFSTLTNYLNHAPAR